MIQNFLDYFPDVNFASFHIIIFICLVNGMRLTTATIGHKIQHVSINHMIRFPSIVTHTLKRVLKHFIQLSSIAIPLPRPNAFHRST